MQKFTFQIIATLIGIASRIITNQKMFLSPKLVLHAIVLLSVSVNCKYILEQSTKATDLSISLHTLLHFLNIPIRLTAMVCWDIGKISLFIYVFHIGEYIKSRQFSIKSFLEILCWPSMRPASEGAITCQAQFQTSPNTFHSTQRSIRK